VTRKGEAKESAEGGEFKGKEENRRRTKVSTVRFSKHLRFLSLFLRLRASQTLSFVLFVLLSFSYLVEVIFHTLSAVK
jgi:hypothetical protein